MIVKELCTGMPWLSQILLEKVLLEAFSKWEPLDLG